VKKKGETQWRVKKERRKAVVCEEEERKAVACEEGTEKSGGV
tara:strand:- start:199 stop:324 length:126 start_codon:yes stop_codon:yes gene_type:complete